MLAEKVRVIIPAFCESSGLRARGIRDSVGLFYNDGDRVSSEEAEEILSRFGKYEGIASYYLIYARFQRT